MNERELEIEYDGVPSDGAYAFTPCEIADEEGNHHCPFHRGGMSDQEAEQLCFDICKLGRVY